MYPAGFLRLVNYTSKIITANALLKSILQIISMEPIYEQLCVYIHIYTYIYIYMQIHRVICVYTNTY